jgi:hypothetical protein
MMSFQLQQAPRVVFAPQEVLGPGRYELSKVPFQSRRAVGTAPFSTSEMSFT